MCKTHILRDRWPNHFLAPCTYSVTHLQHFEARGAHLGRGPDSRRGGAGSNSKSGSTSSSNSSWSSSMWLFSDFNALTGSPSSAAQQTPLLSLLQTSFLTWRINSVRACDPCGRVLSLAMLSLQLEHLSRGVQECDSLHGFSVTSRVPNEFAALAKDEMARSTRKEVACMAAAKPLLMKGFHRRLI